jgi:hypothetical protein
MGTSSQPPCPSIILVVATVCLVTAGCRGLALPTGSALIAGTGDGVAAEPSAQRNPPAAVRTLSVELLFIRHDAHDPAIATDLWTLVDEQALDRELSTRLAGNGLRAGILSGPLPPTLAERLAIAAASTDAMAADDAVSRRVLRLLPGKRAEIVAAAGIPEVVVLEHDAEGVRGGTYRDCTSQLTARAWPGPDGRTRIEVVPELKHGPLQRTWVGEEGMFRLETGQTRLRFEQLTIDALLPHRGMLVIGGADAASASVGDALVRDRNATASMQLILLRPLGTGVDPVFATDAAETTTPP